MLHWLQHHIKAQVRTWHAVNLYLFGSKSTDFTANCVKRLEILNIREASELESTSAMRRFLKIASAVQTEEQSLTVMEGGLEILAMPGVLGA